LEQCAGIELNASKVDVVVKMLQGSVIAQSVLGGLAIYAPVENFL